MSDEIEQTQSETEEQSVQLDPGAMLVAAREARGISIAQIARDLGLTESAVRDLEANRYEKFPAGIYVWGYLKNYCKLLEMDETAVLDGYSQMTGTRNGMPDTDRQRQNYAGQSSGSAGLIVAVSLILVMLGVLGYLIFHFFFR